MKRTLLLALMCAFLSAPMAAQTQGVITGTVRECTGVISGSVTSQIGRPVAGIAMQLLDSSGSIVGRATTAGNGEFSIAGVMCGTDTLRCVDKSNKVLGTSSVTLSGPSQSVKMICTTDVVPFWKTKPGGFLLGAGAAAAAIGATAIISTRGDASGSR